MAEPAACIAGLSRRRSRVRVPSLPSLEVPAKRPLPARRPLSAAVSSCPAGTPNVRGVFAAAVIQPALSGRVLGILGRVVADRLPGRLVRDLQMEAGLKVEFAHQPSRHEVLLAKIVVQAGAAVAAEMAGRELALIAPDEIVTTRKSEVVLVHDHCGQARSRPPLTASAVADTHAFWVLKLVLHTTTQASASLCVGHGILPRVSSDMRPGGAARALNHHYHPARSRVRVPSLPSTKPQRVCS